MFAQGQIVFEADQRQFESAVHATMVECCVWQLPGDAKGKRPARKAFLVRPEVLQVLHEAVAPGDAGLCVLPNTIYIDGAALSRSRTKAPCFSQASCCRWHVPARGEPFTKQVRVAQRVSLPSSGHHLP